MARTLTQNANINLSLNAKQANQMLDQETKKVEQLRKQLDQLKVSGGEPEKLKKLNKEIRESEKLIRQLRTESAQTAEVLKRLDKATPRELNKALRQLQSELNKIDRGSAAWDAQMQKIKAVKAEIAAVNSQMANQLSYKDRMINFFNKWALAITGVTASLTGLFLAARKSVEEFAQMDEAMANTRKFCGLTEEGVRELNEEFKKMDTRTPREKLNELAQEAGRLGKSSKEDILEYVKAADILNVALSDLGDGATQKIAKLSNIFGVEETEGTYNSMVKIGSVINVLSQNSTASKPYLVEFTNRLAGVGNQANMTIQEIVGLGAVLDANAQKVEASATAISQVLTRMFTDPSKYARVAGLDIENFSNLLKTNANEALLQFLEALKKAGKMDVLAPMFKDMGESGSRAISAISTLADKIEDVRWQQKNANQAFEEGTSVLHEFEIFNNTTQAAIDKAKKRVQELTIELGEKLAPVMKHVHSTSRMTLEVLNHLVDLVKEYWKVLVTLTAAIISYKIAINASNIVLKTHNGLLLASTALSKTWRATKLLAAAASAIFTGNVTKANAAMKLFNATCRAHPLAMVISAVTILIGGMGLLGSKLKENAKFQKDLNDIRQNALRKTEEQKISLDNLIRAANNENLTLETRKTAIEKLNSIIPGYNAQLDETTGKYTANKEALDKYLTSLARKFELEGAEEKLRDIGNKKASLRLQLTEAEFDLDDLTAKEIEDYNRRQATRTPGTLSVGSNVSAKKTVAEKRVENLKKDLDNLEKQEEKVFNLYGVDLQKQIIDNTTISEDGNEDGSDYSPTMSDKERKAALKKAQAAFKEGLKAIKAEEEKELNELYAKRATGQIDYLQYLSERKAIEAKFYDDSLKFYEDNLKAIKGYNVEDDKDYQALQLKKTETLQKYENQRISYSAERIKRQSQFEIQELQNDYNWKENKTVSDEIALQERILEIKVKYLQQQQDLYAKGTKEWEDLQLQIEKTVEDDRFNKEQIFLKAVNDMRKKYDQLSAKDKFEQQKRVLYWLYAQEKITLVEYRKLLKQMGIELEQELKKQKESLPGYGLSQKDKNNKAVEDFNEDKKKLDKAISDGLINEKEYDQFLQRAKNKMISTFSEGLKNCGDEWVALFTSMGEAWYNFFDGLGKGDDIENLGKAMQTTTAVVTAAISTITQFVQAEMQIQTEAIEKRYDREVKNAQGNARLVSTLEKKKEEEIAKVKDDANKKMFAMQVIQAIAQTATNALNAYGSAAAIPIVGHIMAPIAAGIATASGLVQVALIKKQQQAAQATGYSEGGFTPKGPKDKEVGVVHAGEWVASQALVNSPVTAPIIGMLEQAQRTNSIASLSLADSNYFAGAAGASAYNSGTGSSVPPQIIVNVPQSSDNALAIESLTLVIGKLYDRLNEPFATVNTMTGDKGIKKAQDDLQRYINNKNSYK